MTPMADRRGTSTVAQRGGGDSGGGGGLGEGRRIHGAAADWGRGGVDFFRDVTSGWRRTGGSRGGRARWGGAREQSGGRREVKSRGEGVGGEAIKLSLVLRVCGDW
jgi:hypothetical protein